MTCACEMGAGMWWGTGLPILVLVVLAVAGIVLVRALWDRVAGRSPHSGSAISVLEERYARGEIDDEEFVARREQLVNGSR